jgi:hypothetical protein
MLLVLSIGFRVCNCKNMKSNSAYEDEVWQPASTSDSIQQIGMETIDSESLRIKVV